MTNRTKLHVKKGDTVKVIAGDSKGTTGTILSVDRAAQTVVVEGARQLKKTVKATQENPTGGFKDVPRPIHVSNVQKVDAAAPAPEKKKAAKKAAKKSSKKAAKKAE